MRLTAKLSINLQRNIFFLCLASFEVVNIDLFFNWWVGSRIFWEKEKRYIIWFGRIATLLNSAINPIFNIITDERYRNEFTEAYCCSKKKKLNKQLKVHKCKGDFITRSNTKITSCYYIQ